MASCSRRPSVAGRTCSRMSRINPARSCIGSMEGLPSPRAEKPRKWRASSAAIPEGAPSHSPCAHGSNGQLQESPAFREKLHFLPFVTVSEPSRDFCQGHQCSAERRETEVVHRRCKSLFIGEQKSTCCRVEETRESERDTHTVGTPEVPST